MGGVYCPTAVIRGVAARASADIVLRWKPRFQCACFATFWDAAKAYRQEATPPCREHVPLRWRLKLQVPSRHCAVAPSGMVPEREWAGAWTLCPSWLR